MMASASELTLECKPHILLKTIGEQVGTNEHDQSRKLEEFLSRLEEERLKIDAFKRELPLCKQLLTNAMETSRQQLQTYRTNQNSPVLEEFIPMKNPNGELDPNSSIDNKANWMTTAQLWSQATATTNTVATDHMKTTPNETDINFNTKPRNNGAFIPFSKDKNSSNSALVLPELALSSGEKDVDHEENKSFLKGDTSEVTDNIQTTANATVASGTPTSSQTPRKTRRCWSPDLHRRFVNALQMLGGSQVATPKQIRELMKVDGLTNDEVKSHLQKYRLHTRRPGPTPQNAGNTAPQLVVLGGIWVPPEYASAAGAQTLYTNATHTNPHYCTPQEFYSSQVLPPPPPQPHHHHQFGHHNNINHMYKQSSQPTQSLQESSGQGGATPATGGNPSESIEDGKSDSGGSWKAESGGETKALVLREECEESNRSGITLKF
ncbi:myb family transcription factor EFM-like [Bidens hawaiensis]|uniref:myb family transcription factor EFM-like n=1 Tax=Bidens hawaiensis TaxID=980011 RepID=UPI00404A1544